MVVPLQQKVMYFLWYWSTKEVLSWNMENRHLEDGPWNSGWKSFKRQIVSCFRWVHERPEGDADLLRRSLKLYSAAISLLFTVRRWHIFNQTYLSTRWFRSTLDPYNDSLSE
jgi:hypothetical protein